MIWTECGDSLTITRMKLVQVENVRVKIKILELITKTNKNSRANLRFILDQREKDSGRMYFYERKEIIFFIFLTFHSHIIAALRP